MKRLVTAILLITVSTLFGETVKPTERTKGCVMRGCSFEGGCITQLFVKVANDENDDPDTGQSQIWGYDPLNVHKDSKGNVVFVREFEKDFLRIGQVRHTTGGACICHCPGW